MDKVIEKLKEALDDDAVVHIKDATKNDGEYTTPFPVGYKMFDDAMEGGVRCGDLVVMTGVSGEGKTTLMSNISMNLSKNNFSSIWFSYEVIIDNLYAKFKRMPNFNLDSLKIYTPKKMTTGNLDWVQKKIREGVEKHNTKFVFIDDMDSLLPTRSIKNSDHETMILQYNIIELKAMAIELEITIFVAVHIKKVYGRAPEMQDLKNAAALFQKPDFIFCMAREFDIEIIGGRKVEVPSGGSNLRFLKNRLNGQKPLMRFTLIDNVIVPIAEDGEEGIEVVDDKDGKWFGYNN